jgi:hypothetical protein
MRAALVISAALFPLCLTASGVGAAPAVGEVNKADGVGVVVRVAEHDCIRDERGWHYMEKNRRRDCRPKRPEGKDWGWKCEGKRCGWWHAKEKHWHDG